MEQLLGIILHTIGGFSSASFYVPTYKIKKWAWETYWILLGFVAWMIMPTVGNLIVTQNAMDIYRSTAGSDLFYTYLFGALWGFGGLFAGLGIRYMGLALGQSVSLGVCSVVGTLVPAIMNNSLGRLVSTQSGWIITGGLVISIVGIVCCGVAGHLKEQTVGKGKVDGNTEFSLTKGLIIATIGGIMSACMAIAIMFGEPIAKAAVATGTAPIFMNIPIFAIALAGGFTTNFIYVAIRSRGHNYLSNLGNTKLPEFGKNYLLAILAGVMWYLQYFFYGMGSTKMIGYEFASWCIHMSSIVIFSNLWGLWLKEWKGTSRATMVYLVVGILLLIISILMIGWGNYAVGF
ncbi:L-rhamnose/proton symporter RhaT [Ravibacter arvi]|uniref:L-rhamnose/proton symporter RhaT n=1 Tax=Ravibacter arvi TaxID=2051041 RepID=A0ABP8LT42_9BACT